MSEAERGWSRHADAAPAEIERLRQLAAALTRIRRRLRYVDYREAERLSEKLAGRLLAEVPRDELRGWSFRAIPRGGVFVLGMLSYLLDLEPERLAGEVPRDRPLILVDDCALSGARLARELDRWAPRPVVFAHLFSTPELRRALAEREPRVAGCLAAEDLVDRTAELLGEGESREEWERRWQARLEGPRYWLGQPDPICFAWSEPDRPFWNPVSRQVESGWRFLPPHRCLKHRSLADLPAATGDGPRRWRAPEGLAVGRFDDRLWLWSPETDRVLALRGPGAEIWRALAVRGDEETARRQLARLFDAPAADLERDVREFAAALEREGLLEAVDG